MRNFIGKTVLGFVLLCWLGTVFTWPQGAKSPDPLAKAMLAIQSALTANSTVSYTLSRRYLPDDDSPASSRLSMRVWNVIASPRRCTLTYRWQASIDGQPQDPSDLSVSLKDVTNIEVQSVQDMQRRKLPVEGEKPSVISVSPEVYVVLVKQSEQTRAFHFYKQAKADEVAHAIRQAASLCGAGLD